MDACAVEKSCIFKFKWSKSASLWWQFIRSSYYSVATSCDNISSCTVVFHRIIVNWATMAATHIHQITMDMHWTADAQIFYRLRSVFFPVHRVSSDNVPSCTIVFHVIIVYRTSVVVFVHDCSLDVQWWADAGVIHCPNFNCLYLYMFRKSLQSDFCGQWRESNIWIMVCASLQAFYILHNSLFYRAIMILILYVRGECFLSVAISSRFLGKIDLLAASISCRFACLHAWASAAGLLLIFQVDGAPS